MKFKFALLLTLFLGLMHVLAGPMGPQEPEANQDEEAAEMKSLEDEAIARVGQPGVIPPDITNKVAPIYPKKAKKEAIQGFVIVDAIFYKNGRIGDLKVLRGLGDGQYGFEEAAMAAVSKWRFKPGKVGGKSADVRISLKVDFTPPAH